MNALVFSGTNLLLSKLTNIGEKSNAKDIILHLKSFRGLETNAINIEWNNLVLSINAAWKQ